MDTTLIRTKGNGLAKPGSAIMEMDRRIVRARESFNEKIARASAEYADAMRRAVAAVSQESEPAAEPAATPVEGGDLHAV
jgi:hypothetical protein